MSKILINKKQLILLEDTNKFTKTIEELIMSTLGAKARENICGVTITEYYPKYMFGNHTRYGGNLDDKRRYLKGTVYVKNISIHSVKAGMLIDEIWQICHSYTGVALSIIGEPCDI
jgi:hypothetical protein